MADVSDSIKSAELRLACHIASHSSVSTVDHLGEIVGKISGKEMKIHRTKCGAIIKNLLAPMFCDSLLRDVRNSHYSLIIDESTDVGTQKQLCVIVRYYSKKLGRITTTFLGIVILKKTTAEGIFQTIQEFLIAKGLSIEKCVGLATDGCNTMCGVNNSVITLFREVCPNIVHIKCICHSIQLCSSYALKVLPRSIEYMVSETYNWFSHSAQRQDKYADVYRTINVGEEPLKILRVADTRWLSIAPCVARILHQYDELKLHFQKYCRQY